MKRKIIITESQYIKLQELLFETADINHTLDFAKVGDVLKFKTPNGGDYTINVKQVNAANNEILGDNHGIKVILRHNSYDEKSKKLNYQEFDKNTNKYVDKSDDVNELDIVRNGKVVDITDVGSDRQPINQKDPLRAAGEQARKEIDYGNDPLLKKAFHRQAGFWAQFQAELAGKSSKPDGIKSVLDILAKYTNNKVKNKFGDVFTEGKEAKFQIISRTNLGKKNGDYNFLIRKWTEGDSDTLTLSERNKINGLRLIVEERKKGENDVYLGKLKKLVNNQEQEEEVEVKFFKSAGYNPTITTKQPTK
jgi:hypothetical protein